jgi:electron transfer flavoprotein alpha subunit
VGAVLVHIDLDGDRPHASSLAALAAGRAISSSWGATLYAALVVHDAHADQAAPDSTAQVMSTPPPGVDSIQNVLARAGADKVIVAVTDAPVAPLWAAVGVPWQGVLDHIRPRLVLFGADAPSASELGPRTGARIGARLLQRARATSGDQVELRDRDGGYVRASDGGAAVAMIGSGRAKLVGDDDIDLVVLVYPGGADQRIEVAGQTAAELAHSLGPIVALGDDVVADAETVAAAKRLAAQLGAQLVGGPSAVRAGAVATTAVIDRHTPLAPELCIAVGAVALDLAGSTNLVRIGPSSGKGVEGVLSTGAPSANLTELVRVLEDEPR